MTLQEIIFYCLCFAVGWVASHLTGARTEVDRDTYERQRWNHKDENDE